MTVFRPGRRWFTVASLALAFAGALHTWGQLQPPPPDPALLSTVAAMRAFTFAFGALTPSLWDVHRSLHFTMSTLLLALAAANLLVVASAEAPPRLLRRFAALSTLCAAALVALYAFYQVLPPLLVLAPVAVLFAVAWLRAPRAA